nr:hypothetical protein [Desulfovibrio sp. X2]
MDASSGVPASGDYPYAVFNERVQILLADEPARADGTARQLA